MFLAEDYNIFRILFRALKVVMCLVRNRHDMHLTLKQNYVSEMQGQYGKSFIQLL